MQAMLRVSTRSFIMENLLNPEEYDLPRFRTVPLGYSKQDIIEYLDSISNEILAAKHAIEENKRLKEKAIKDNVDTEAMNSQKLLIAKALIDAQAKAKTITEEAEAKSKDIIARATAEAKAQKEQAETAVKTAETKLKSIQNNIAGLKELVKNM
jgi:cell division septum initiation protein DivIVA